MTSGVGTQTQRHRNTHKQKQFQVTKHALAPGLIINSKVSPLLSTYTYYWLKQKLLSA